MIRPGGLVSMPDVAVWLVNATPPSTPRSKTEVHVFTVCRREEPVKTSQLNELVSVHSHEATRGKQGVTRPLMLGIKFPAIKTVVKLEASRTTCNRRSTPIIAPRRNRKNVGRFKMPYERSDEIMGHFQIVIQKNEDFFAPFRREPVIRKEKIVFRRDDYLDRRKFAFNPGHIVVRALVVEDYNRTSAGKFLGSYASRRQQMFQMLSAVVIQNRQTNGLH